ncbi:putative signal transducing protein [Psychroserpens sp. S379A]|uniref:putative signal transducing protein n=1 Tax=Psychroserpens sp. S379A TaxID=3415137 RepID=UPI003C79D583
MTDTNYNKVFSGNFIVVQMIKDRLESAGISPIIKDESESGRLAGFGASIQGFQELYVSNEELSKATAIVDAVNEEISSSNES